NIYYDDIKQKKIQQIVKNISYDAEENKQGYKSSRSTKNLKKVNSWKDAYTSARKVNMFHFLQARGYDIENREGEPFSCIFNNHIDEHPSAVIYTNQNNEHRYICFSHISSKENESSRLNLSLIDLWAQLQNITLQIAVLDILQYANKDFLKGHFIMHQRKKYQRNTALLDNMNDIKVNYPYLHQYIYRYELELRTLMQYAEKNLHGDLYSYNDNALFYISSRHMAKLIGTFRIAQKGNIRKANNLLTLFTILNLIKRVPEIELSKGIKNETAQLQKDGNRISFYFFQFFKNKNLMIANNRAKVMWQNNIKLSILTQDVVLYLFQDKITRMIYGGKVTHSDSYRTYVNQFAKVIMNLLQRKDYTTKKEVIAKINLPGSENTKGYHFDKII